MIQAKQKHGYSQKINNMFQAKQKHGYFFT